VYEDAHIYVATKSLSNPMENGKRNVTSHNNSVITKQAAKELFASIKDVKNHLTTLRFKFINITFG
jgi:hypothetical protein